MNEVTDNTTMKRYSERPLSQSGARVGFFWALFFVNAAVFVGAASYVYPYAIDGIPRYTYAEIVGYAIAGGSGVAGIVLWGRMKLHDNLQTVRTWYWAPVEEDDDYLPEPVALPQDTISIAGRNGEIVTFRVSDRIRFIRFLNEARLNMDDPDKGPSLSQNDAAAAGIGRSEWHGFFEPFKHNGWVRERKNRKPVVTAVGTTVFQNWLNTYGFPSIGESGSN